MLRLSLLLILPLLFAPAWAASTLTEHATHPADGPPPAGGRGSNLPMVQTQLRQRSAELERLQRDVSDEELRSHQADQRLRQQDRSIEQLRRQLQALDGRSSAEDVPH